LGIFTKPGCSRQHLSFVLRQKGNTTFKKKQPFQALNTIPVQPGSHIFYSQINLTQNKGFSRFNLYHFHKIVLQLVGMVFVSQFPNIRKKKVSRGFGLKFGKQ
jgi:hypothetical protein